MFRPVPDPVVVARGTAVSLEQPVAPGESASFDFVLPEDIPPSPLFFTSLGAGAGITRSAFNVAGSPLNTTTVNDLLDHADDTVVDIQAVGIITLDAGGRIGGFPAGDDYLDLAAGSAVTADADGDIGLRGDGALTLTGVTSDSGDVDIVTDGEVFRSHFVHGFLEKLQGIDWQKKTLMGIRDNRYELEVPTAVRTVVVNRVLPELFNETEEALFDALRGDEAHAWGFYNQLFGSSEVVAAAHELARSLAHGPTFAHMMTKTMLDQEWSMGVEQAIEAEAQAQAICMQTRDFERAYRAFVNKEKPVFEGD